MNKYKLKNKIIQLTLFLSTLIKSYIRILKMSKKPTKFEYLSIVKISSFGILIIGIVGFLFYFILDIFPKMV